MLKEKCVIFSSNESLDKDEVKQQKHKLVCLGRALFTINVNSLSLLA